MKAGPCFEGDQGGKSKHWIKVKNRKHPAMQRVMDSFKRVPVMQISFVKF
jgi:hypothetical protein